MFRGSTSKWQLPGGISLGTTLAELEQPNGRPFILSGFGWDYAGAIYDWRGGALDSLLPGVRLYFSPGLAQDSSHLYSQELGDREFPSDSPAMQALEPSVYQILVDLP